MCEESGPMASEGILTKIESRMTKIEEQTNKNRIAIASGLIPKELEGQVEFKLNDGNLYASVKKVTDFAEAKLLCQKFQMSLVTIEGAEENNFIQQWAQETNLGSQSRHPWIG